MTIEIDITEAHHRFLELIQAVERGEAVIITKHHQPVVQIIALQPPIHRPTFGSARGLMTIMPDFDVPLDDFRDYMP